MTNNIDTDNGCDMSTQVILWENEIIECIYIVSDRHRACLPCEYNDGTYIITDYNC